MSSLAAIGAGSGINFSDVYDKLKKAEEASVAARPDKKLEQLGVKQKDLTSLMTHINTFKGSVNSLKDGSLFLKRDVNVAGVGSDSASVSVDVLSGVNKANFSLKVEQIAKKDSYQSDVFNGQSSTIFNSEDMYIKDPNNPSNNKAFNNGSFTISIDNKKFTINVSANDTLETLVDKMANAKSDEYLSGSSKEGDKTSLSDYLDIRALKVDSNDNYRLVVSSKETGVKNQIKFETNGDNSDALKFSQNILNKLGFGSESGLSNDVKIKISDTQTQMDKMLQNIPTGQTEDDVKNSQAYQNLQKKLEEYKTQLEDMESQGAFKYVENQIKQAENDMNALLDKYGIKKDSGLSVDDIVKQIEQSGKVEALQDAENFKKKGELKDNLQSNLTTLKNIDSKAHISTAQDAIISYDGITVTRSSNQVDDLIPGANIKLLKTGESNVNISSNTNDLKDSLKEFVKNYNTLIANLDAATAYNAETKISGTFQGVNEVTRIKSELSAMINSVDTKTGYSLGALGFEINKDGVLEFDSTKFDAAYDKDPVGIEGYFSGKTNYTPYEYSGKAITESNANTVLAKGDLKINGKDIVFSDDDLKALENNKDPRKLLDILKKAIDNAKIDGLLVTIDTNTNSINFKTNGKIGFEISGNDDKLKALGLDKISTEPTGVTEKGIFTKFRDLIDSYVGSEGSLTKYNQTLVDDTKKTKEAKEQALKDLESKYNTMATKFNLYDQMITKMKSQENVITSMINAQFANK